mmetsp:Transcript_46358/g.88491  ORF Transcript_46358/g.88491 Transcript_46358/m.88491 type:complete len:409 (-) Transcript_46358:1181-2407(-)
MIAQFQVVAGEREHVVVVPHGDALAAHVQMLDGAGLVHCKAHRVLRAGERVASPVGPAHRKQRAAGHSVSELVHEVVDGVAVVDVDGRNAVSARKELAHKLVQALAHPRDVSDDEGARAEAVEPVAALQEAQQDGGPEREEDVHRAVRKQHQPHQPRPRRQLLRAGEHKQAVEHRVSGHDGGDDVARAEDPRHGGLEDVQAPQAALCAQRNAHGGAAHVPHAVHPHNVLQARQVDPIHGGDLLDVVLVKPSPRCLLDFRVHEQREVAHEVEQQLGERLVRRHEAQTARLRGEDTRLGRHHVGDKHQLRLLAQAAAHLRVPVSRHHKDVGGHGLQELADGEGAEGAAAVGHDEHQRALEVLRLLVESVPGGGGVELQTVERKHLVGGHGLDAKLGEAHVQVRRKLLPRP